MTVSPDRHALAALAVLDRIPLSAYRPRPEGGRTPRRRRRPRRTVEVWADQDDTPPTVTVARLDQPPVPPRQLEVRTAKGDALMAGSRPC